MRTRIFLMAVAALLIHKRAYGYIDPGSGMAFVSGIGAWIVGVIAVFFGAISMTFKKWRNALKNIFSSSKKE